MTCRSYVCFLSQSSEKKEIFEAKGQSEGRCDATDSPTKPAQASGEGGGAEQPFIKLSQEEYGEHHSSIMHCRWVEIQNLCPKCSVPWCVTADPRSLADE